MADEQTKIEVKDDVQGTTQDTTQETQAQSNPQEEKASSLGWVSREEWVEQGKDPDDWKPAKLFLEHGEMIGKIRNQSKEVADLSRAVQFMHEKNKQVYEKGYQAAITELRAQKRAALAEGDLVKADEIDEKIDATREELQRVAQSRPPAIPQTVDPEHAEWLERNPWYNEPRMQRFADSIAIEFVNQAQGRVTPNQVRKYVEEEVKKEFAHKFTPKTKGAPNPDGEGRATRKTSTNGLDPKLAQAESSMTDEQKSIMRTMIKSTGMTKEKYLKLYLS